MKVIIKRKTPDYREAQELFAQFKQKGTAYLTYDFPSKTYTVEIQSECETEAQIHRAVLLNMYYNVETEEEATALSYADSAIKTLIDMGVLK